MREIIAPLVRFSHENIGNTSPTSVFDSDKKCVEKARSSSTRRSVAPLPPLEAFEVIAARREAYQGPSDESNWVIPGRLMVGAFPGAVDDVENASLLGALLAEARVSTFVCLQREYEPAASEQAWRAGRALRPYFASALELSKKLGRKAPLAFLHFGIEDCSVVEDDAVTRFSRDLARRLRETDEVVYLHCWGGHGRAGTVVCLLLHWLYGLDATAALYRCQFVHDLRRVPIVVGSPQTQTQREQVCRVIQRSETDQKDAAHRAALRAAQEAPSSPSSSPQKKRPRDHSPQSPQPDSLRQRLVEAEA